MPYVTLLPLNNFCFEYLPTSIVFIRNIEKFTRFRVDYDCYLITILDLPHLPGDLLQIQQITTVRETAWNVSRAYCLIINKCYWLLMIKNNHYFHYSNDLQFIRIISINNNLYKLRVIMYFVIAIIILIKYQLNIKRKKRQITLSLLNVNFLTYFSLLFLKNNICCFCT